jgi:hypothetical protein
MAALAARRLTMPIWIASMAAGFSGYLNAPSGMWRFKSLLIVSVGLPPLRAIARDCRRAGGTSGNDTALPWCVVTTPIKEVNLPNTSHTKAAEAHETAAKSHRTAAEHHAKGDHASGQQHSTTAHGHSESAHKHSQDAHTKSGQHAKK